MKTRTLTSRGRGACELCGWDNSRRSTRTSSPLAWMSWPRKIWLKVRSVIFASFLDLHDNHLFRCQTTLICQAFHMGNLYVPSNYHWITDCLELHVAFMCFTCYSNLSTAVNRNVELNTLHIHTCKYSYCLPFLPNRFVWYTAAEERCINWRMHFCSTGNIEYYSYWYNSFTSNLVTCDSYCFVNYRYE